MGHYTIGVAFHAVTVLPVAAHLSGNREMYGQQISFEHPWYLVLLVLLLPLWWFSFLHLRSLGPLRRWFALILRTALLATIIFAIAGVQLVQTSQRVTVMYVLDQSASIPSARRQMMLDFVIRNVKEHRVDERGDKAGIVIFGREAMIEYPPLDEDLPNLRKFESDIGARDATNLEAALKLAQASMPEDSSRRVVIVSDGNENIGNAEKLASRLSESGIGINVVPVPLTTTAEVIVEKVDLPKKIRVGQPFEARVVITAITETEDQVRGN